MVNFFEIGGTNLAEKFYSQIDKMLIDTVGIWLVEAAEIVFYASVVNFQRKFSWETSELRRFKNAKSPVQ